ncbi:MAG TPA: phosphoenolpyruvate carboxykinase, partial [Chloroflexia bacterium]|nr:phosphoenolpyruvate carboxykinase [Chloroflexia bacterium]
MQTLQRPPTLEDQGITNVRSIGWNLPAAALYEEAVRRAEGVIARTGPLVVRTGQYTGRSPKDKFVVREASSEDKVWWGPVNQPFEEEKFDALHKRMLSYIENKDIFVQDLYVGADPEYRLAVRVITESAWANLFARNLFIRPRTEELEGFQPTFTVIEMPGFKGDPARDGTRSEAFVILNFAKRLILIGGTAYAGEIKKSMFTVMNYFLPLRDVVAMHCSANSDAQGENVALFFGLSGTGKTTLSADPSRTLIGDDEHGWSDRGVFNFEGGCYAKVINLSEKAEPAIWAASHAFGPVLENVMMDISTRSLDLTDEALTENTRSAYPIEYIPNASPTGSGGHPRNVLMLSADAFGVLPPVAKLTRQQAMYYFLSGYTAKLAGTERGVTSPEAEFSTCFGAPFLPLPPMTYARLLGEKMDKHKADVWLVNTGWSGGAYGTGERMSIAYTRAIVNAIINGDLAGVEMRTDPVFGFQVPVSAPGVPAEVLNPRNTWADKDAYDTTAHDLVERFRANFAKFAHEVTDEVKNV